MTTSEHTAPPNAARRSPVKLLIDAFTLVVCAFLSSILGISTAAVFGVFALVVMADLSLDLAITAVAVGLNAMLLSLVTLGNMRWDDDEQ